MKIESELEITATRDLVQMSDGLQELTDAYANIITKILILFVGLVIGLFLFLNWEEIKSIANQKDQTATLIIRCLILLIAVIPEAIPFI